MQDHQTTISRIPTEKVYKMPFLVTCSCAWQSLAPTEEVAENLAHAHVVNRAMLVRSHGLQEGRL